MSSGPVLIGNTRRVIATFKDLNGDVFDGTTVTVTVQNGLGVKTVYTYGVDAIIVRDSLGVYHIDLVLNVAGTWGYYWQSSGNVAAAGEGFISVKKAL